MKQISILFLLNILFIFSLHSQIVDKYVDKNDESLTVIKKVPKTDNQRILNTLDIDEYSTGDVIFIQNHLTEAEKEKEVQETIDEALAAQANIPQKPSNIVVYHERVERPSTSKKEAPERNPIGEKVRKKKKRAPRWNSDKRRKTSISKCFKF